MNRLRITKLYAAASILLPAAAVLIWRSELWLLAVFIAWILIAALLWVWCERKEHEWRMATLYSCASEYIDKNIESSSS